MKNKIIQFMPNMWILIYLINLMIYFFYMMMNYFNKNKLIYLK